MKLQLKTDKQLACPEVTSKAHYKINLTNVKMLKQQSQATVFMLG